MASRDPLEEEFREFVAARSGALLRTAYLLAGDWATAEDLLQTALTKTYLAWKRLGGIEAVEPYARRVLVNTSTSWWRRRWHGERPDRGAARAGRRRRDRAAARPGRALAAPAGAARPAAGRAGAALLRGHVGGADRRAAGDLPGHGEEPDLPGAGHAAPPARRRGRAGPGRRAASRAAADRPDVPHRPAVRTSAGTVRSGGAGTPTRRAPATGVTGAPPPGRPSGTRAGPTAPRPTARPLRRAPSRSARRSCCPSPRRPCQSAPAPVTSSERSPAPVRQPDRRAAASLPGAHVTSWNGRCGRPSRTRSPSPARCAPTRPGRRSGGPPDPATPVPVAGLALGGGHHRPGQRGHGPARRRPPAGRARPIVVIGDPDPSGRPTPRPTVAVPLARTVARNTRGRPARRPARWSAADGKRLVLPGVGPVERAHVLPNGGGWLVIGAQTAAGRYPLGRPRRRAAQVLLAGADADRPVARTAGRWPGATAPTCCRREWSAPSSSRPVRTPTPAGADPVRFVGDGVLVASSTGRADAPLAARRRGS